MRSSYLISLAIPLNYIPLVACESIGPQPRRLQLDAIYKEALKIDWSGLQPLHDGTKHVVEWEKMMESELRKTVEILDEWAQESFGTAVDIIDNIQDRVKLLDNTLIIARSHCYSSKLNAIAQYVTEISESVAESHPDVALQVQEFQKIIKAHHQIPPGALSTSGNVWEKYTNETSVALQTSWSSVQTTLKSHKSISRPHSLTVTSIGEYISTGFASSWKEIKTFTRIHKFTAADIERFIEDHPIMFAVLAVLLVTGGVWLMAGPEIIIALLQLIGFTSLGPVAGSLAAQWQSISYGAAIPKGSVFSVLQKAAMTRVTAPSGAAVLLGGALVAAGGFIIYVLVDGRLEISHSQKMGETTSYRELD